MARVILIFFLFALIHSVTVTRWFKHFCKQTLGDSFMRVWYRFVYIVVSVMTAGISFYFIYHVPDRDLWIAPPALQVAMHVAQVGGLIFGSLAFEYLDAWEFMGIKQVWRYLVRHEVMGNIEGLTQKELVTNGVYGVVRHPIYLAGIVIFTLNPRITVNSLTITILADIYFLVGAFIEERRFLMLFGDQYREYMKRVPRLLPRLHSR